MKILRSWDDAKAYVAAKNGAVTIGNFDGVHLGHQQVLAELRGHALAVDGPSVVVTFEPHPRAVLFPDESPRRLCHLHERLELLRDAGADVVFLLAFNKELAGWTADKFMQTLHNTFGFKHIHVGYDFAFGRNRAGHSDDLRKMGDEESFTVSEAAAFEMYDAVVSSSRIRSAIEAADFDLAKSLLGRLYSISGHVMHGDKRGRKIGFPTANLDVADLSHPPAGIYAARAHHKGKIWNSAVYLGYRPTFDGRTLVLEAHVLDESPELYNDRLEVEFIQRVREDRTFTGADDLARQIAKDCNAARKILSV